MDDAVLTGRWHHGPTTDYVDVGPVRRLVRRIAANRPMTWLCVRFQEPLDRVVYRLTHGRTTVSSLLSGLLVVMLTTTGAKTGRQHTRPVLGLVDGNRLFLVASNYGRPYNPAWYHNLQAHAHATVAVHGETHDVEAHELTGQERDRWFLRAATMHPGFVVYQERTPTRRIPVLQLEPSTQRRVSPTVAPRRALATSIKAKENQP